MTMTQAGTNITVMTTRILVPIPMSRMCLTVICMTIQARTADFRITFLTRLDRGKLRTQMDVKNVAEHCTCHGITLLSKYWCNVLVRHTAN